MPRSTGEGSSSSDSNRSDGVGGSNAASGSHGLHGSHGSHGSQTHPQGTSINDVIRRVHAKLGHDRTLSVTDHLKGVKLICRIRDSVANGNLPSQQAAIVLLCTGVSLQRRFAVGDCSGGGSGGGTAESEGTAAAASAATTEQNEEANEEARQLVRQSMVLVFSILCMIEHERTVEQLSKSMEAMDVDVDVTAESRELIGKVGGSSLWEAISLSEAASTKRAKTAHGGEDASSPAERPAERPLDEPRSQWSSVLRASSGEIARHSLRIGSTCLDDETWTAFDGIAPLFFRNSSNSMAEALLMPDGDKDFVSLGTAKVLTDLSEEMREKKLLSIVGVGESEAGQQVVRDIMLSFLLPSSHVGVRRTLLLTREASTRAGVDHPTFVQRSHDTAMAGTEWIWTKGDDTLERMCCLLAGLAVLTTKADHDPIRKADAFGGRLLVPFFETKAPPRDAYRIALVPRSRRWILFHLDKRNNPQILSSQRGFKGLCDAVLQLVASLR